MATVADGEERQLSLEDQIIAEKTVCILLVTGEDPDGGSIFAYVAIRADRLQEFMAAQGSDTFYPEDFGVIIEAGEGEPSEELRRKMETEYGFNHETMAGIVDVDAAHDLAANLLDRLEESGTLGL
jgi:hypothetical protein